MNRRFHSTASAFSKEAVTAARINDVAGIAATTNTRDAATVLIAGGQFGWHSSRREQQSLRINFAGVRTLSSLLIYWGADHATSYDVQVRNGGSRWRTADSVNDADGARQFHWFPQTQATAIRLLMKRSSSANGYHVKSIAIKPADFAPTRQDFFLRVAERSKRGYFPGNMIGEPVSWVDLEDGRDSKYHPLLNQDGMLEFDAGCPSLEPFIFTGGKLLTWADCLPARSPLGNVLPVATVARAHDGLALKVTAFSEGTPGSRPTTYASYQLVNTSDTRRVGKLFLALRPFRVGSSGQTLDSSAGGFVAVDSLKWGNSWLQVGKRLTVYALTPADRFGAMIGHRGSDIVQSLAQGALPVQKEISASDGTASGAMEYAFDLAPGEQKLVDIAALHGGIGILRKIDTAFAATVNR